MILLVDLVAQYHSIQPEIDEALHEVLENGHFILGPQVTALEQEIAAYLNVLHAVGVASGTDALVIALRAVGVGPGDEVIVSAYTFFATVLVVDDQNALPSRVRVHAGRCSNVRATGRGGRRRTLAAAGQMPNGATVCGMPRRGARQLFPCAGFTGGPLNGSM